ncbi:helix-turn-helix transcriptional regulator [uncultured Streptomyces sp.]|uniref:helix-turn-helix domain-containing protein n=1 Tax=uncultured Streptomyces sp. TaxID=174707 RepID=UPI002617FFA9|nr:helix-turn-helix transcriptional regulator [uncultured Streptomyces sp.]
MNKKDLNPDASPAAAFGARIRSLREERGWKQEELAEKLGYSGTHVSAVETGRKLPTVRFSRSADRVFGAGDMFERLWRELRNGVLLEGFPEYVGYEARAVEIRLFEIGIIPGLLQTPEYARVLAESAVERGAITPEQADERVAFLAERQSALERAQPPLMLVVMDESCIRRPVGGPGVMARQMARLVEFAKKPTTVLQTAPFDLGERRAFNLPVNLLTLPDRSMVAYAESQTQGHLDREITSILPLLTTYHQLQAEALSQAASVAMVRSLEREFL